ncbi:MAG: glycosyltransferase family 39 protein [Anaerolineae bacterium]|nr:glycosyltransferase family 39 protein [Anaerolineae bacterium]
MKRRHWWLVLILLLAAGLRFFRLDGRSLWFDEALSVLIGRLTLQQVLSGAAGSSHPPGYYFLLHVWQALGMGGGDWLLRYPSVFASVLSVVLTYRVGRSLFDGRTGLLAALGMAIAPFQVYYAQEVRMYAPATALTLGVTWCFVCVIRRPRAVATWVGYAFLAALGLYTHYFVAWVLLCFHLWLLMIGQRSRNVWLSLLLTDSAIGLTFLPQTKQFLRETGEFMGMAWREPPNPLAPLTMPEYLLFGHVVPTYWWWGVRVAVVTLSLAFATLEWVRGRNRVRRRWAGLLLLVAVLPPVLVVAISWLVQPVYLARSFAMFAPFLVLFLAQGVAMVWSRLSPTRLAGLLLGGLMLVGTMVAFTQPDISKPPVREAQAIVTAGFLEGDLCLHLDETYPSALVYGPEESLALLDVGQHSWLRPSVYQVLGGRLVTPGEALATEGRLWLVISDRSSQPWEEFLGQVEQQRRLSDSWRWDFLTMYLYE